jgi:predicted lipoprotein with Yx(FWY)xxD motif
VKRLISIALLATFAVVVLVAAGGGGSKNGSGYSAASSRPAAAVGASTIGTTSGALGKFLVDARGRTLYMFEADKTPNMSNCSGACQSIWPPSTTAGKLPATKHGVQAAKLGMTAPVNGKSIVTYNGHPLYHYVGDRKPGDTSGQGLDQFGGGWYVVAPTGDKIDNG